MSELEFGALQFGVNFIVNYNLRHYVDKVCQRYLHFFIYFENFVILQNYFMILFYFLLLYFIFKVILYYSLYGFTTLGSHFDLEEILLHFYWLIILMVDGVANCHNFTSLKL